jgi:aspartyl-tRNA(Asn)/glutamyl-tRNA(Gln) amidotransferase subunit A
MSTPLSCRQIAAAVQSHERTARAVADEALGRAERLQDKYHAFIAITPELARRQATKVDELIGQGRRLPLAGVPFAVKDLLDIEGLPTTCGSRAFADRRATADATVVRRLVEAGAVLLGKLNLHECAFGFTGANAVYGDCKNPWNADRIAGGSSSGSAVAVALGICGFSLGSDTGGSIRLPAALCSVTGLKPTYGRVSRQGVVPLSWTLDHVGPLARTADDVALVLESMAGHDAADEASSRAPVPNYSAELDKPLRGLRLGVPGEWFFGSLEPAVGKALDAAIAKLVELGCSLASVELPHLEEALGAHRAIIFPEAASYHEPFLRDRGDKYGDDIRPLLAGGLVLPAADYLRGQRARRVIRAAWAKAFSPIDFLVAPASPITASRFGQQTAKLPRGERPLVRAYLDVTLPFNLSGQPAMSVPCGFSPEGMPIGLQLVGKPFAEGLLLRVGHQYQQATDWHRRRAPGAA